jgi:hypothetical protein
MGLLAGSWLRPSSLLIPSELHPPLAMPLQPPNGVCRLPQPTAPPRPDPRCIGAAVPRVMMILVVY